MSLDCQCYINPAGEKIICVMCKLQKMYIRELIEQQEDADKIIAEAYRIIREVKHGA